jgi:hypothetical protein
MKGAVAATAKAAEPLLTLATPFDILAAIAFIAAITSDVDPEVSPKDFLIATNLKSQCTDKFVTF